MPTPDERLGNPPTDLLWIMAHPDDESYGSAGTMAWARDAGLRTAYICATRGEVGEIRQEGLATPDTLGAVREQELREAMALVGLGELRVLGFRDSGMEGTDDTAHPMALVNQPTEALLAHLVGHIRDLRPRTVITFGPDGVYGHPDHLLVGELATRAVALAADATWMPALHAPWRADALYHSTVPRDWLERMAEDPSQPLGAISDEARRNLGTPMERITHRLDVSAWLPAKREAILAHRTQFDPDSIAPADEADAAAHLGVEHYVRQPVPWDLDLTVVDALERARQELGTAPATVG